MEMFNPSVAKQRIGHLKKSSALDPLRDVERYFLQLAKKYDIETSYDVLAGEIPYFHTIAYTEYATCFMMHPLNLDIRVTQIMEASQDTTSKELDFAGYFANNIKSKLANKYQDRKTDVEHYPDADNLVVLPGSNKIKTNTCLNKMNYIKKQHNGNVYFKPHPITTHTVIGELKDKFGEELILPRDIDMYHFLEKAYKVYTTHISESTMYAAALGKEIEPIDVHNGVERGSFYHVNKFLFEQSGNAIPWINRTLSSYKSGIICPKLEENWKEKMDKYFEYLFAKRELYRNWYIDDRTKKKLK